MQKSRQRLFQLSYLRAFVTPLVVIHHSVLAYFSIKPPRLGFTYPTLLCGQRCPSATA